MTDERAGEALSRRLGIPVVIQQRARLHDYEVWERHPDGSLCIRHEAKPVGAADWGDPLSMSKEA